MMKGRENEGRAPQREGEPTSRIKGQSWVREYVTFYRLLYSASLYYYLNTDVLETTPSLVLRVAALMKAKRHIIISKT